MNNDLISRRAALDAFDDYLDEYSGLDEEGNHGEKWCAMSEAKMVIENLPSAQAEIIRCKDCKHWREGTSFSYCDKLHGMGVLDALDYMTAEDDYCSMAERREK